MEAGRRWRDHERMFDSKEEKVSSKGRERELTKDFYDMFPDRALPIGCVCLRSLGVSSTRRSAARERGRRRGIEMGSTSEEETKGGQKSRCKASRELKANQGRGEK